MITERVLSNLNNLERKIPKWSKEAILKNKGEIVNLVKFSQLAKGINSYNTKIGNYALSTQGYADADNIQIPKTFGAPYNFQWTGETFDNMKLEGVDTNKSTFDIGTAKGKQRILEQEYGEIFDLTEKHNNWVNENIIEPYVAKKIEENLFVI
tara:strand:+ start:9082 stop:9540 length:459 start_codon:yes stop_codon:yes gene_type:complete